MREFSANPKKAQKGVIREGLERSPGPLRRLALFQQPENWRWGRGDEGYRRADAAQRGGLGCLREPRAQLGASAQPDPQYDEVNLRTNLRMV